MAGDAAAATSLDRWHGATHSAAEPDPHAHRASKLETEGVTTWDKNLGCKVEHRKRHPAIWWLVAFLAISINVGFAVLVRMANEGI